jgi:hypothetical protein
MKYLLILFLLIGCYPKKMDHKVSGEAKIRMIAEQDICTEDNGFKTDEQKRECIMAFIDCKAKALEDDKDGEQGS